MVAITIRLLFRDEIPRFYHIEFCLFIVLYLLIVFCIYFSRGKYRLKFYFTRKIGRDRCSDEIISK